MASATSKPPAPVVDSHAHPDEVPDLSAALEDAARRWVVAVVAVGSYLESNRKTLDIAGQYPGRVLPALGLHPWELDRGEAALATTKTIAALLGVPVLEAAWK